MMIKIIDESFVSNLIHSKHLLGFFFSNKLINLEIDPNRIEFEKESVSGFHKLTGNYSNKSGKAIRVIFTNGITFQFNDV